KWLEEQGSDERLHPNDDVNKSQSSNDTYPTAFHVAAVLKLEDTVLPAVQQLKATLKEKMDAFEEVVKIGRTHLQDVTPLTFGQEISGLHCMLERTVMMISESVEHLKELSICGTAVGTVFNAHPEFTNRVCNVISKLPNKDFNSGPNKFHPLTI